MGSIPLGGDVSVSNITTTSIFSLVSTALLVIFIFTDVILPACLTSLAGSPFRSEKMKLISTKASCFYSFDKNALSSPFCNCMALSQFPLII